MLSDYRKKVFEFANARRAPRDFCWIQNDRDSEQSEDLYCDICAPRVVEWILGGKFPKSISNDSNKSLPDWKRLKADQIFVYNVRSSESDGCEHCAICGHMLSVSLTNYGIESEIDHFEQVDISTIGGADFWHWLDVIDGLSYVEWCMEQGSVEKDDLNLYERALAVTEKMFLI